MRKLSSSILVIPLTIAACAILGGIYGPKVAANQAGSQAQMQQDLKSFAHVYSLVQSNYATPVKADKAIYDGAIPGMLRVLDPHSTFFDPQEFARMRENQSGRYYGVGMSIQQHGDHTIVLQPFEGTPAYRAGLRPGDVIAAIDGKSTKGMDTNKIASLLKGPKGTTVHLSIVREGHPKPIEFTLVRAEVHHNSVDCFYQIQPGVAYIHLSEFTETSGREINDIIRDMGGERNIRGMVLDLRGNPGGLLSQAVEIADRFLSKGQVIVSHHGRSSAEHTYRAEDGNHGYDFPLVVLVNNMTASASEIVSGAIQDHDRGLIVGQTTFGKGLVQTVFQLSDDTGLALTTAHYYTPSGRLIQRPYNGLSLYDYYWGENRTDSTKNREVRMTDSGRTVYGGGGITPDVILPKIKLNEFQKTLAERSAFFDFADYFLSSNSSVPRSWHPDSNTINAFEKFLTQQHIDFTANDIQNNLDWIKLQIRKQVITNLYGENQGLEVLTKADPEVIKAVDLLPQAEALAQHAREILAARQNAANHPPHPR